MTLANHDSREVRKWDADLAAAPTTNAVHTATPVSQLDTPPVVRLTPEMRMRQAEAQAALADAKCWLLLLLVGAALQLVGCFSIFSWVFSWDLNLLWCAHLGGAMVLVCACGFDCVLVAHSETWARSPVDPRGSQPSRRRRFWGGGSLYACLSLIISLGQTTGFRDFVRHLVDCRICGFFFWLASIPAAVFAPLLLLVILCGPVYKELAALGRAAQ